MKVLVPTKYYLHISKAYDKLTIIELEQLVKENPGVNALVLALLLRRKNFLH